MKYKIKPGHSFLDSDGTRKEGGAVIELSDDVAAAHADKIDPAPADAVAVDTADKAASRK